MQTPPKKNDKKANIWFQILAFKLLKLLWILFKIFSTKMETNFLHLYVKHFDMLGNVICYPKVEQDCSTPLFIASAETSALIGEKGRGGR
jgi:hypothetical protein